MKKTRLGSLDVSVIGLGCNNFGRALDPDGSQVVVDAAFDSGINFFDTSDNYGQGRSESYLGTALGSRREDAVVATKFSMPVPGVEGSGGARPEYIRRAVERSLNELETDRIDLYQLHKPDPATPIAETIGAMAELVDAGKVIEIGCTNLDATQLSEALAASESAGHPMFVSDQVEYSMLHRAPETNGLTDVAGSAGVALLPFYPLACGMLTGKAVRRGTQTGRLSMDRYQHYLIDANFDIVDALAVFCEARGVSMAQLALAWLLSRPEVPAVTPGATSSEQVHSNASAGDWTPSADELSEIERILASSA